RLFSAQALFYGVPTAWGLCTLTSTTVEGVFFHPWLRPLRTQTKPQPPAPKSRHRKPHAHPVRRSELSVRSARSNLLPDPPTRAELFAAARGHAVHSHRGLHHPHAHGPAADEDPVADARRIRLAGFVLHLQRRDRGYSGGDLSRPLRP